jgi:hypothetical protein
MCADDALVRLRLAVRTWLRDAVLQGAVGSLTALLGNQRFTHHKIARPLPSGSMWWSHSPSTQHLGKGYNPMEFTTLTLTYDVRPRAQSSDEAQVRYFHSNVIDTIPPWTSSRTASREAWFSV